MLSSFFGDNYDSACINIRKKTGQEKVGITWKAGCEASDMILGSPALWTIQHVQLPPEDWRYILKANGRHYVPSLQEADIPSREWGAPVWPVGYRQSQ